MTAAPVSPVHCFEDTLPLQEIIEAWRSIESGIPADTKHVREVGDLLRAGADSLIRHYRELLAAYEGGQSELAAAQRELDHVAAYLADPEDDNVYALAQRVRWYHDRAGSHHAWAVCQHEMCREAGRWVS
jgi:hypothetical protein